MNESMPLSMTKEGKKCEILEVNAGRGLSRRLAELGFVKGSTVTVTRSEAGAMIVFINGQRFALSRGIAMKISVRCQ
ncbi:MAG TPA: FeoA family protein [Candidatus Methanofastidiosa archaeon]|nr:FeoA family protein [Candidatus Methanofastidiosa archaeon]HPR41422.1 FeoA family protein [Candidatus Methanofastidiosa archaeon]